MFLSKQSLLSGDTILHIFIIIFLFWTSAQLEICVNNLNSTKLHYVRLDLTIRGANPLLRAYELDKTILDNFGMILLWPLGVCRQVSWKLWHMAILQCLELTQIT